jgi:hypothetical protein
MVKSVTSLLLSILKKCLAILVFRGGDHPVLLKEVEGTDMLDASPACFILYDQCFSPVVPAEGDGECLKILQIEDGTLVELIDAFLDITKGFSVPAGSVVVISSASYLARVGTAAYAAEYADVRDRLRVVVGGGIELIHGFPILLGGTEDSALIRSLADLGHWLDYYCTGRDIKISRGFFSKRVLGFSKWDDSAGGKADTHYASASACTGTPEATVRSGPSMEPAHKPMCFVLPSSQYGLGKEVFRSPGYNVLPTSVPPCETEMERLLLDALIEDINNIFMCNLAHEYCTSREGTTNFSSNTETANKRYIVIGASHAGRLASALKEMGSEVADLSVPGWKISSAAVESSIELLKEVLDENWEGETIIIYQIFDNTSFFSIGTDGTAVMPVKSGTDGKYHIVGALGMGTEMTLNSSSAWQCLFSERAVSTKKSLYHH